MIHTFETISPYELLKSKNDGAEPTARDLKLAEDLIINYGLNQGVVNVLIDYMLKTNNNKLTRNLAETIAGQWSRNKVETVEEAMEIAKKNHKSLKKKVSIKTEYQTKEKELPDWFDKNIEVKKASDEEIKALEELLKEYR